jgi:hypothetical protein
MQTETELEGAYRLVNDRAIAPQQLFDSFSRSTAERAEAAGSVPVNHDTTTCSFNHADPDSALPMLRPSPESSARSAVGKIRLPESRPLVGKIGNQRGGVEV